MMMGQQQPQTNAVSNFDPRNLEIKTRSVEQTLLPLVQQISTLVNFKESIITGGRPKSERALRAALKIGTAVEAAVERFVAVGETIADENPDIQPELYDACHEARIAGSSIANLHSSMLADPMHDGQRMVAENGGVHSVDTGQLVRAARQLLSSVTRVLLLADRVLVKHILRAEDKIAYSLTKLEHTSNFSEFVQIFTEFGGQMVDLAHRSGDRQQDMKSEKRRAQMQVARAQLERLTMLLLTSSKTVLRHPDDQAARQCRDGIFHQIRSALQLISVCVTDGVMHFDATAAYPSPLDEISRIRDGPLDIGIQLTTSVAIRQLCEMLDMCRMMSLIGAGVRERLVSALGALCEMSADFTESAWTPLQQREQILDLLEECRFEMGNLVNPPPVNQQLGTGGNDERLRSESIDVTVERLNRRLKDLRKQFQVVALEQIATVFRQNDDQAILSSLKTCSISGDIDGVERFLEQFRLHAEHLQEVCRLLHHISLNDALHVFTGHAERNLRALAPMALLSGRVLCVHPSSRIARENLEVFCDTWATNVNDLARLTKELDAACSGRLAAEKQAYMSLPRPGRHGTTSKPTKPITLDAEDQQKIAKVGLEMKLLTDEMEAEAENWDKYAENDIVKRAKAMSAMSYNMYLFTKGDGPLKTTHDLFTQAEFFAEQANKMHKTVREFAFEVPGSAEKNELLNILEKIPLHCQQLQVLVKSPTVGKTATFSKVDAVISETKGLMNEVAKLVTACFVCATKFEIEFRGNAAPRAGLGDTDLAGDFSQRASRESSAVWRRTPSMRRPAVTQQQQQNYLTAGGPSGDAS